MDADASVVSRRECEAIDGERRKLRVLNLHAARHSVEVLRARRLLLQRLLIHGTATADDVRRGLGELPEKSPRWLGVVPVELRDAGIIRRAGYVETGRALAHRRPVSIWELANRDAAERWLMQHPPPPGYDAQENGSAAVTVEPEVEGCPHGKQDAKAAGLLF